MAGAEGESRAMRSIRRTTRPVRSPGNTGVHRAAESVTRDFTIALWRCAVCRVRCSTIRAAGRIGGVFDAWRGYTRARSSISLL
jgi:hypothetical protein